MKVVYTDEALRDLDEILTFIGLNYPTGSAPLQKRLHTVEQRIGKWPKSAEEVVQRPGVHVVPLIRYPYKIFGGIAGGSLEIAAAEMAFGFHMADHRLDGGTAS